MALSPQDIHNKEFSVKMRGYNIDQVNDFLDQIVKDYQHTLIENNALKKSLKDANNNVNYYDNLKNSLNQSILVAQEAANKVRAKSDKQSKASHQKARKLADKVVDQAKGKADHIVQDSIHKADQLIVETTDLRKSTNDFRHKVQTMLKSQLELLNSKKWSNTLNNNHKTGFKKLSKDINQLNNLYIIRMVSTAYYNKISILN
ncbi:MAG: DivIVA domain-containing protein [Acetilactobacillus jinshanensis]